jgi:hypothetical protein
MTGAEYEKAIARLDLSLVEAARFLGIDDTTSRRWVKNISPVPRAVAILLRLMIRYRLAPDHVQTVVTRKLKV